MKIHLLYIFLFVSIVVYAMEPVPAAFVWPAEYDLITNMQHEPVDNDQKDKFKTLCNALYTGNVDAVNEVMNVTQGQIMNCKAHPVADNHHASILETLYFANRLCVAEPSIQAFKALLNHAHFDCLCMERNSGEMNYVLYKADWHSKSNWYGDKGAERDRHLYAQLLKEHLAVGLDPNVYRRRICHAITQKRSDITALLIGYGAWHDITTYLDKNYNPYHVVQQHIYPDSADVNKNIPEVATVLVWSGFDPHAKTPDEGDKTAFEWEEIYIPDPKDRFLSRIIEERDTIIKQIHKRLCPAMCAMLKNGLPPELGQEIYKKMIKDIPLTHARTRALFKQEGGYEQFCKFLESEKRILENNTQRFLLCFVLKMHGLHT